MRRGFQENLVIALVLVGGLLYGIGWLFGVVLLWLSDAWTARQKLVGTLVVPGGLGLPVFLAFAIPDETATSCLGGTDRPTTCITTGGMDAWERWLFLAGLGVLAAAAIAAAVFLARRARPRRSLAVSA